MTKDKKTAITADRRAANATQQTSRPHVFSALLRSFGRPRVRMMAAALAGIFMVSEAAVSAGVIMPSGTPLQNFGFAAGGRANTKAEYEKYFNITRTIFGTGGLFRTGLGWDPTRQTVPGFDQWAYEILQPATDRGVTVVPSVRTINLGSGELRIPTDAQWAHGLREVVRVLGPNGVYQKGGTYVINGRTVRVAPHPNFKGITDFEIWNEPESKGDAHGQMTAAKMAKLLKIAASVMRDQASKQGFTVNIMGPGISGFHTDYLRQMKSADPAVFSYMTALTIHAYTRNGASQCKAGELRCVKSLDMVRTYLNTNGGAHLHLGVTEAGVAGDRGTCLGPQVRTEEQQRDFSTDNFNWMRARPYLKMDFWITTFPYDRVAKYKYACSSQQYDPQYWESKLGVVRADGSMKPWGVKWKQLAAQWRAN